MVKDTDFTLANMSIPAITEGQILIKNEYISLDPAMRGWMNEGTTYIKGVEIGEVMRALGVGIVIESKNGKFKVGDAVSGLTGVQLYTITDGSGWFIG
jgi:NADPH-dependent curcumin reductase